MHSIAWDAESNPSVLDYPNVFRCPITNEKANSQHSVTQNNADENFSHRHKTASNSNIDKLQSDTHLSQDYVNAPKTGKRVDADVLIKNDETWNSRHVSNIRHDTESTSSSDQKDEPTPDESFQLPVNTNYDLTVIQSSETYIDIVQVPNTQILQWHTEPLVIFFVLKIFIFNFIV